MVKAIKVIEEALKNKQNFSCFCMAIHSKKKNQKAQERDEFRKTINPEVRKERGYLCKFCGKNVIENSKSNTIHHIIPERYSGTYDKKNLLVICSECHILLEKYINVVEREAIRHTLIYLRHKQTANPPNG